MTVEQKIQDDITISLKAQKIIVHETVRVNVGVSAQIDAGQSEDNFRREIQTTLKDFIDTDWKIQSIQRSKGTTRYESVYVQATARVSESENHQLQERTTALSRIGFELVNPTVDYSLTFDDIQKINQELRLTLFEMALVECAAYNMKIKDAIGKFLTPAYRVSSSRFDIGDNQGISNATNAYTVQAMAKAAPPAGAGVYYHENDECDAAAEESLDLNVSTRFAMTGTFTLRSLHG